MLGINTARSLTFKDGRISHEQMRFIRETFAHTDARSMRILVTHHPLFALPVGDGPELGKAIGRQELALDAIAECYRAARGANSDAEELLKGALARVREMLSTGERLVDLRRAAGKQPPSGRELHEAVGFIKR